MGRSDLETLKRILRSTGLKFILKFHKRDVMTIRNQSNFLESRKPETQMNFQIAKITEIRYLEYIITELFHMKINYY
jgi:hypothetical protein